MQNFKAVLFRRVPRPDSPDLGKSQNHTVCFGSIIVVWIVVPLGVSFVFGSKCMYYEWFLYVFVEDVRI